MALDKLKEKALEAAGGLKSKVSDFKDNIFSKEEEEIKEEFKDSGTSKIQEIINYITGSTEIVKKAGFDLAGMEIAIAIIPEIKVVFTFLKRITAEERNAIAEEVTDKKIVKILLSCLFKASDFVEGIKVGNYKLKTVEVSLGLSPGINVIFEK